MNVEKELKKDGILVTEMLDTDIILKIAQNVSEKIANTFPNLELDSKNILGELFSLSMYRAIMPEGMAEANYCYKNSSIYFNSHIANEDLEEFAIHECLHFLQEVKNKKNKIKKMGLAKYSKFRVLGTGINEAAVQYMSAKIIGIEPDFEKYYDINLYTPSPSYYPVECALLNELLYFIGEDILFRSTYFSTDDFKNEIIKLSSKKVYNKIIVAFDKILKYEEQIILLKNKDDNEIAESQISKLREDIYLCFIETQNLIIKEFFDNEFNRIENLEDLELLRRKLTQIEPILGTSENYQFFKNYYTEMINKLEHKENILENGETETAVVTKSFSAFSLLTKLKYLLFYKKTS